jgi:stage II sporulation protein D
MLTIRRQTQMRIAIWLSVMLLSAILTFSLVKHIRSGHLNKLNSSTELHIIEQPKPDSSLAASSQLYQSSMVVSIYLSKSQEITRVPLEQYIAGVVAAEMPVNFELEALKAQAIAARTYIVRRIINHDLSGMPVKGAEVTDSVTHQAFLTNQQLEKNWGSKQYDNNMDKINNAVYDTRGLIITYANQPINATYFSASNGYTENSEDYWGIYEPYLRSVASPWDRLIAPRFTNVMEMPIKLFMAKLGLTNSTKTAKAIPASLSTNGSSTVLLTQGHRISSISIAGKTYTGKEIREQLSLASSAFSWIKKGDTLEIKTLGSGHGVGMSQWGANGMAKEGKSAIDILQYYYKDVQIKSARNYIKI